MFTHADESNPSLWCTYMIVGIAIIAFCGAYYYSWMTLLPRWGGYAIRSQVLNVDDNGANTHRLLRVPNAELAEWDASHDELGRELTVRRANGEEGILRQRSGNTSGEEVNDDKTPVQNVSKI
jgi:hypothetical protein